MRSFSFFFFFFLGLATLCDSFNGDFRALVLAGAVWKRKGGWALYGLFLIWVTKLLVYHKLRLDQSGGFGFVAVYLLD